MSAPTRPVAPTTKTGAACALADRPCGVSSSELADALRVSQHTAANVIWGTCRHGRIVKRQLPYEPARWFTPERAAQWDTAQGVFARQAEAARAAAAAAAASDTVDDTDMPPPAGRRVDLYPVPGVPGWGGPPPRRAGADDHRRFVGFFGGPAL